MDAAPPANWAAGVGVEPATGLAGAPLKIRKAASISFAVMYLSGNTPTDMPLSKSTSNVETMSIQPSAWVRLPTSTSRFRTVSTRKIASGAASGLKMAAISAAPINFNGIMTVP